MTRITLFGIAALTLVSSAPIVAQPPSPRPASVCLNVSNIQRTETPDDSTIIFHMRDGKVWRNTLKRACPMLTTSPWTQVLTGGDLVCSNQQFIHIVRTGDMCSLGNFTPLPAER